MLAVSSCAGSGLKHEAGYEAPPPAPGSEPNMEHFYARHSSNLLTSRSGQDLHTAEVAHSAQSALEQNIALQICKLATHSNTRKSAFNSSLRESHLLFDSGALQRWLLHSRLAAHGLKHGADAAAGQHRRRCDLSRSVTAGPPHTGPQQQRWLTEQSEYT